MSTPLGKQIGRTVNPPEVIEKRSLKEVEMEEMRKDFKSLGSNQSLLLTLIFDSKHDRREVISFIPSSKNEIIKPPEIIIAALASRGSEVSLRQEIPLNIVRQYHM